MKKPSKLKLLRLSKGLSQTQLARESGLHQPNISLIENGEKDASAEELRSIMEVIGEKSGD